MEAREMKLVTQDFPDEILDRIIFAVQGRMTEMVYVPRWMTAEKCMAYLSDMGETTFYKLVKNGEIEQHFFKDCSTPFYCPEKISKRLLHNADMKYNNSRKSKLLKKS